MLIKNNGKSFSNEADSGLPACLKNIDEIEFSDDENRFEND